MSVPVAVRIRPLNAAERLRRCEPAVVPLGPTTLQAGKSKKFTFDHVYGPDIGQRALYDDAVKDLVRRPPARPPARLPWQPRCCPFRLGNHAAARSYPRPVSPPPAARVATYALPAAVLPSPRTDACRDDFSLIASHHSS